MRRTVLICSLLLSLAGSSFTATAEELPNYATQPAVVSTSPAQQAEPTEAESSIGTSQAEEHTADNNIVAPTVPATPKQEETAAEVPTTVNEAKAPMAEVPTTPAAANTAAKPPVISNEPVPPADKPKPKPKLNLVGKPPLPRQFMRTPQASDFISVSSEAGGYSMAVPKAFGKNPLADLPQAEGAMLVRTAGNNLMLAATVLDPADTASFKATEALPVYENAKVYWQWQHGSQFIWNCLLSAHNDYHGNKLLLTAEAQQNGKTYQLLYVMPAMQADNYLPQAIYSLDSFKLNQP
ncbi:hypothetical protein [Phascolarctobacterium succinatutens]|uniref:hypothetical protein n=1 Tax=Phascolarctobacterium succinatutens TaxID=626940 RepID=UPI0026EBF70A|nr:hypothetical protein [Phascolarctobacterium succinatutens]